VLDTDILYVGKMDSVWLLNKSLPSIIFIGMLLLT
jgi:hypothetical protein